MDYESLDGEVSRLFFMIAAAEGAEDTHIELLSKLSTILLEDEVREALLHAKSKEEVIQMLEDEMAKEEEEESFLKPEISQDFPEVLAVTACPTGIAHTYMAADSLRKKRRKWESTSKWKRTVPQESNMN